MFQSADEQVSQANKDAEELTHTLNDQLARGRIDETFRATLSEDGFIVPSGYAPTTPRQTMMMLMVKRLITMDKQDDGSFIVSLNRDALRAAAEGYQARAQLAQGEASKAQAFNEAAAQREARAAEQRLIEQERAARLRLRGSIRANF